MIFPEKWSIFKGFSLALCLLNYLRKYLHNFPKEELILILMLGEIKTIP